MKRKMFIGLAVSFIVALGFAQQDAMRPSKFKNVTWYELNHVDYFPHSAEEAIGIVFDHFIQAAEASGMDAPEIYEYATGGEWDICVIFPLSDGPAEMEWEMSPESVKWMTALAEQMGGAEEAKELFQHYLTLVNRFDTQIVRQRGTTGSAMTGVETRSR